MTLAYETINFFAFVIIGFVFCILFDIFRALRMIKKINSRQVCIQDVIYFLIVGIILVLVITKFVKEVFRFYYIIGVLIGITTYIGIVGNFIRNLFVKIFKAYDKLYKFIMLPLTLYITIFEGVINKFKKIVIKCCKKISYMVNFYYNKLKNSFKKKKDKQKRVEKSDKKWK